MELELELELEERAPAGRIEVYELGGEGVLGVADSVVRAGEHCENVRVTVDSEAAWESWFGRILFVSCWWWCFCCCSSSFKPKELERVGGGVWDLGFSSWGLFGLVFGGDFVVPGESVDILFFRGEGTANWT